MQSSFNRGFFYVWADKLGTLREEDGEPRVWGKRFGNPIQADLRVLPRPIAHRTVRAEARAGPEAEMTCASQTLLRTFLILGASRRNYAPVWTPMRLTYEVSGKWPEKLWKQRKLSHPKYKEYLYETRDGVLPRRRNLDAVLKEAREVCNQKHGCALEPYVFSYLLGGVVGDSG